MASRRRTAVRLAAPPPARAVPVPVPPRADDATLPADVVEVARVLGAWGVQGALRIKPFAAQPQALLASARWWLQPGAGVPTPAAAPPLPALALLHVEHVRAQGETLVVTCREVSGRDAAERLAGARVFVSRASFPKPDEGEFYWVDLIGLEVRNRSGRLLGEVSHLLETGPHSVLCVQPPDAAASEVLIPFVDAYVDRVDHDGHCIRVDWDDDY